MNREGSAWSSFSPPPPIAPFQYSQSNRNQQSSQQPAHQPSIPIRHSEMRSLPLYSSNSRPSTTNLQNEAAPRSAQRLVPSKPYQTREHLYYLNESAPVLKASAEPNLSTNINHSSTTDTGNAPPINSLYELSLTPDRKYASLGSREHDGSMMYVANSTCSPSKLMEIDEALSRGGCPTAPPTVNTNSRDGDLMERWITVFGFNSIHASAILEYFRSIGPIEKYEISSGNWIHIQYASTWSSQKALLKNGTILSTAGSCMIGVMPACEAMQQVHRASISFMSPLKSLGNPSDKVVITRPLVSLVNDKRGISGGNPNDNGYGSGNGGGTGSVFLSSSHPNPTQTPLRSIYDNTANVLPFQGSNIGPNIGTKPPSNFPSLTTRPSEYRNVTYTEGDRATNLEVTSSPSHNGGFFNRLASFVLNF